MEHDRDPATQNVAHRVKPEQRQRRFGCGTCAFGTVATMALGVLLFVYVLVPLFQPQVEANLTGPVIASLDQDTEQEAEESLVRGSITDILVKPAVAEPEHPLDPLLEVARKGLKRVQDEIADYTATVVKQEQVNGKLRPKEFMYCKVRHHRKLADGEVPKSIYIHFLKPRSLAGQEAIWVEGKNNGKLIGHAGGILNIVRASLNPTGPLAMKGNRYPITELGIENLIERLIEKGERDRKHGECEVNVDREVTINDNLCTVITVTHPTKREHFDFHIAKIYIDDELDIPIGYQGYLWPIEPGDEPVLVESYFYQDVKLNVGLADADFDPDNPKYNYP